MPKPQKKPQPKSESPSEESSTSPSTSRSRHVENPRKKVNFKQLDALLQMQATAEECAAVLDMSESTLDARVREEFGITFHEYAAPKKAMGRMSLRRAQFVTAVQNKNVTMQIWLGKNMLEQKDRQEITGKDGAPITGVQPAGAAAPDYSKLTLAEMRELHRLTKKARANAEKSE